MKNLILLFFLVLSVTISGCSLFDKGESDVGHCDKELFELVREKGSFKVWAIYEMEYNSESELNEEEVTVQRKRIAEMHEKLVAQMNELNIRKITKSKTTPKISMFVDEEALQFLCTSDLVQDVQEVKMGTIH